MTRGEDVIAFIETYCRVPEGAHVGDRVELLPFQRDIVMGVYDSSPPLRRVIVSMGRKNAKSCLTAMLLLAAVAGPAFRPNAQVYSSAQSRDQAAIIFAYAAKMVRMDEDLSRAVHVKDTAKELIGLRTGVHYKALSADATTAHGTSPALVIHDETGRVRGPRSELYDALETGMGAHKDPLSIIISTQAPTDADLLSTLIDSAKASNDPTTKLFLWAADPGDDPWSEATWHKANPGLGTILNLQELKRTAEQAQRLPALESSFRNLHLNQRVAAEDHFLSPAVWALNGGDPDPSAFEDGPVFGGLDLSSRQDLTALVLAAKDGTGTVHVQPHFWAPARGLRERAQRDRAPYDLWRDRGLLTATPGASVDHEYVAQCLANLAERCDLRMVKFDRWRIEDLKRALEKIGAKVPLDPHGQGYRDMSGALDQFEALALNGRLRHGNHPVLTWCAANAVVTKDAAGNRKLDRSRATGRIDGLVAAAMAVAAMSGAPEPAKPKYQMFILQGKRFPPS
jgi:phage terminase large subunit-like protein